MLPCLKRVKSLLPGCVAGWRVASVEARLDATEAPQESVGPWETEGLSSKEDLMKMYKERQGLPVPNEDVQVKLLPYRYVAEKNANREWEVLLLDVGNGWGDTLVDKGKSTITERLVASFLDAKGYKHMPKLLSFGCSEDGQKMVTTKGRG